MVSRRVFSVFVAGVLAVGVLAVLPGCDWLHGSDPGSRQSPFLSSLSVSPSSVLCEQQFSVSFRYDDPQGDIARVLVTLQRSGDTTVREESPAWPAEQSRSSGTVSFPFSFTSCVGQGGSWTIKVDVEDDRGHTSNILSGDITLNAAG